MSLRSAPFRRACVAASAIAVTTGALVGLAPTATAADRTVTSYADLQDAVGTACEPGSVVTIGGIVSSINELTTSCDVTIDLAGEPLTLGGMVVGSGTTLTVTDSTAPGAAAGVLTTMGDARGLARRAGITTTSATLVLSGRATVQAYGYTGAAGIGGDRYESAGTVLVTDDVVLTASGSFEGAGIGGGEDGGGGTVTVSGNAVVTANGGGSGAAGIGGGHTGAGGITAVSGNATVFAYGGQSGAGIGGGMFGPGGSFTASGGTVFAYGSDGGAGIGGGWEAPGGTVQVFGTASISASGGAGGAGIGGGIRANGGTFYASGGGVFATGGDRAAGIGGGNVGTGGTTTITGTADVSAGGGSFGAGIGGGLSAPGGVTAVSGTARVVATGGDSGAGIGGGQYGVGSVTTVGGSATVTATGGGGAAAVGGGRNRSGGTTVVVGGADGSPRLNVRAEGGGSVVGAGARDPGSQPSAFGSLQVERGVLNVAAGPLHVIRGSAPSPEVTVGAGGVIESVRVDAQGWPQAPRQAGSGTITTPGSGDSAGRIQNGGAITLPSTSIAEELAITDHDYDVSFVVEGSGSSADPADVRVYAESFAQGERDFPADPTRPGFTFQGWRTADNVSVTATSTLPGAATEAGPAEVVARAVWERDSNPDDDPEPVTSYDELQEAVAAPCAFIQHVRLDGPINEPRKALTAECRVTVDLNGNALSLRTVDIADETLTITDLRDPASGGPGQLTTTGDDGEAGIDTNRGDLELEGRARLDVTGGSGAAGIGGAIGDDGGDLIAFDSVIVEATGGTGAAGIGGGAGGDGARVQTVDDASITAVAGPADTSGGGAGIGGGAGGAGGFALFIDGSRVTATGASGGAGVGGGSDGDGGFFISNGQARVVARGGDSAAGIGGGHHGDGDFTFLNEGSVVSAYGGAGGAGVGGGAGETTGGQTAVQGFEGEIARLNAIPGDGASAVQLSRLQDAEWLLRLRDGVLNVPEGDLQVDRDLVVPERPEVWIDEGGVIESRQVDPTTGALGGPGTGALTTGSEAVGARVLNDGVITIPTARVAPELLISNHDYLVTFDLNGGGRVSAGESPVEVFAPSFAAGERSFPTASRSGYTFVGWNTAADGRGTAFTETSALPDEGSDGSAPLPFRVYAQWSANPQPPVTPEPPVVEPLPEVSVSVDGRPKVGERLTASASLDSDVVGVSYAYQWLRDGEAIAGADSASYRPTRGDVAREVSVRVTASAPGRESSSGTSRSVAVRPVVGIVGATRVGEQLTPRVVVPDGARASYVWETSRRPGRGEQRLWEQVATGSSYTLRGRDAGTRVRLVVTITGAGFSEVRSVSVGRFVGRFVGR